MTFRKAVDDYDYARILEGLVTRGKGAGLNVQAGEQS